MLLPDPARFDTPFPYFTARGALGDRACETLAATFAAEQGWERHDTFYQCWMRDITASVADGLRGALICRMSEITGLPLTSALKVTAQRMLPGDRALPHSDRPLLGYEAVRLVVQLTPHWQPQHGGWFLTHADAAGTTTARRHAPLHDTAVGFAMLPHCHHAVTPVTAERQTVVFNFWHAANTPALRDHLGALFGGMRFSALPRALDGRIARAEQRFDDETTLRAGTVAFALMRWGYAEQAQAAGYEAALRGGPIPVEGPQGSAVALARWVGRLWHDDFDLTAHQRLAARLDRAGLPEQTVRLAFPG